MKNNNYATRPIVGFLVEGYGEYNSFPTIFSHSNSISNPYVICSTPEGCGGISKNFEENLDDIVTAAHPLSVVVTVDFVDLIKKNLYSSCIDIIVDLKNRYSIWFANRSQSPKHNPLPEYFTIVIQMKKFESWIAADQENLVKLNFMDHKDIESFTNIDEEIEDPSDWLRMKTKGSLNTKKPKVCKNIFSNCCYDSARGKSRSFDKFIREIKKCHELWLEKVCN